MKKVKKKKIFLTVLLVIIVGAFAAIQYFGPTMGPLLFGKSIYLLKPSPKRIGSIAFDYMDRMGLYTSGDDWQSQRKNFKELLTSSKDEESLRENLEKAVKVAGGKHSFIMDTYSDKEAEEIFVEPQGSFENGIVYVKLPAYMGNQELGKAYADKLVSFFDRREIEGVIVDLRGNTGGDMGPMLAGLSPIIEDGTVMYFKMGGSQTPVKLEDGANIGGGSPSKVNLKKKIRDIPIAVLTDEKTASSAEAILVILKGNENTKVFGKDSAGFVSANSTFNLTEDMTMVLTNSNYMDKNEKIYPEEPIAPDVPSDNPIEDAKNYIEENK
ncbi:MAG: S41 family peptidase [Finegoldia sp.]|nr:S41 family peptidase [Finegoldia sp.]